MSNQFGTLANWNGVPVRVVTAEDYDELRARLAEAHASLAEGDKRYAAENARLAARLAEAERDAARLDWLDTQAQPVTDPHDSQQLIAYGWGVYGQRTTVREAIDAARATDSATGGKK